MTAVFASICSVILVYLTLNVIRLRYKHQQAIGLIKTEEFDRRNGALSNFIHNTPMALILFAIAEVGKANCGILFFIGGIYILARLAHIYSLYVYEIKYKSFRLRMFAMITTLTVILALAAINLYIAAQYI